MYIQILTIKQQFNNIHSLWLEYQWWVGASGMWYYLIWQIIGISGGTSHLCTKFLGQHAHAVDWLEIRVRD